MVVMDLFILELGWVHSHWAVLGWSRSSTLEWDTNPGACDLFHQGLMCQVNCHSSSYMLLFFSMPV